MNYSIIIPTFNRAELLKDALKSLFTQTFDRHTFEILILDNASNDHTKQVVKEIMIAYPKFNIRYIYEPEPGLLSGRHRGALESQGEILIFIDDDIKAHKNWLAAINESFKDPSVQLVGGRNLPEYKSNPPEWLEWFWSEHNYGKSCSYLSLLDFGQVTHEIDANYIWGLNFSIRRQALFNLGGFHPDSLPNHLFYFQGDGETGLTIKANQANYKAIYQPEALVFHQISQNRMTYNYFQKRCFYQGGCNSFTNIRKFNELTYLNEKVSFVVYLKKFKNQILSLITKSNEERNLKLKLHKSLLSGYNSHQNIVYKNPCLLEWIMKPNYWNYRLPQYTIIK